MMPVLSSFISYRPKRRAKVAKSPFTTRRFDSEASPHPYASSSVVFDINKETPGSNQATVYEKGHYSTANASSSPQVGLDLNLNQEPLTNWFPTTLLGSEPFTLSLDAKASGSGASNIGGSRSGETAQNTSIGNGGGDEASEEEEEEDSSSEDVLAGLEAMTASTFVNLPEAEGSSEYPSAASMKKAAPTPITIPSLAQHGPKMHILRSPEVSRPTSQASSPESSAISGTTLARALMANSFTLSGDSRGRYRSGGSTLTRSDSATLPRGEFAMLHSPYWRDRTLSGGEISLSPDSAPIPPVPPVPVNAELVYVPPKMSRQGSDVCEKPQSATTGGAQSDRGSDSVPPTSSPPDSGNTQALRRISRITEGSSSLPPTPQPAATGLQTKTVEETKHAPDDPNSSPPLSTNTDVSQSQPANEEPEGYREGLLSPGQSSTFEAPSSAKDIENVLDYYSFVDPHDPTADRNFRPVFTPITEESSSQLSPPTPYKRESRRSPSIGKTILGAASPGGYVDLPRRSSEIRSPVGARDNILKHSLLPIGERPRSTLAPLGSPKPPSSTTSASDLNGHLLPPPVSSIFNRQRSGSAPSPIKVVRDSHDYTAYNITVTPQPEGYADSPPITGNSDIIEQTFPETPSAFSPFLSAGSVPSPGMPHSYSIDYGSIPAMPQTPLSAHLSVGGNIQPSLAQQVLLTRAATSVRHSRQASLNRGIQITRHPYARHNSIIFNNSPPEETTTVVSRTPDVEPNTTNPDQDDQNDESKSVFETDAVVDDQRQATEPIVLVEDTSSGTSTKELVQATSSPEIPLNEPNPSMDSMTLAPQPPSARSFSSADSGQSEGLISVYRNMTPTHSRQPSITNSRPSSRADSIVHSSESHVTIAGVLPPIPPSPKQPPPAPPQPPSTDRNDRALLEASSSSMIHNPDQNILPLSSRTKTPVLSSSVDASPSSSPRPPPPISHSQIQDVASPLYSLSYEPAIGESIGSPPPYDTVFRTDQPVGTPSTGGSYDPHYQFGTPYNPHSPSMNGGNSSSDQQPPRSSSARARRARVRPPLPAGPRRPSQQHNGPPSSHTETRARGGSVSSVASNLPSGSGRRFNSTPLPSPKFQVPPLKWKGYTMDAAKWTFTSAQLQAIVSRAIRQSSEASSIRLLRLEILDNEIQEELEMLETKRTEIKVKYRTLARRRTNLLDSLSNYVDGVDQGRATIHRLVDDLKSVSASLDKLAEELYSVEGQLAQLSQLCQVHSTSALAMALRKLNASFLKQFAEAQVLRNQMQYLEAERDEAWKHAADIANDYDELSTRKRETPSGSTENRSSRMSAVRKSSIMVSKAGLRSSNRRLSQRSSVSSHSRALGANQPSSARNTFYGEDVPPVPRLPRHRPKDIMTDLPIRSPVGISTSGLTPTSETRAMIRAQEELYDMLGIPMNDNHPRRSRSVIGLPSDSEPIHHTNSPMLYIHPDVPRTGRRASLPGSPAISQSDTYQSLAADVNLILTRDRSGWI